MPFSVHHRSPHLPDVICNGANPWVGRESGRWLDCPSRQPLGPTRALECLDCGAGGSTCRGLPSDLLWPQKELSRVDQHGPELKGLPEVGAQQGRCRPTCTVLGALCCLLGCLSCLSCLSPRAGSKPPPAAAAERPLAALGAPCRCRAPASPDSERPENLPPAGPDRAGVQARRLHPP